MSTLACYLFSNVVESFPTRGALRYIGINLIVTSVSITIGGIKGILGLIFNSDAKLSRGQENKLKELDIAFNVKLIGSLIMSIDQERMRDMPPLVNVINGVKETLDEINGILTTMHEKQINHKQKYFSGYRKLDIDDEINKVVSSFNILKGRYSKLVDIYNMIGK